MKHMDENRWAKIWVIGMFLAVGLCLLAAPMAAYPQSHGVTLSCTPSTSSTSAVPGTTNVFRLPLTKGQSCPSGASSAPGWTSVNGSAPPNCAWTDSAVTAATTYAYYVEAVIAAAPSQPSNITCAVVPVFAPSALSCTDSGATASCTWTASTDAGTAVTLLEAPGSCPASGALASPVTVTTSAAAGGPYTLTGLAPGSYCIQAEATLGGVASPGSNTFQLAVVPAAPTNLSTVVE